MPPSNHEFILTDEELELAQQSYDEDPPQGEDPAPKEDPPEPEAKGETPPATGEAPPAAEDPPAEDPPAAEPAADPAPAIEAAFAPRLESADVAALDAQIKSLAENRTALMKKWRAGDIDDDTFDAQTADLEAKKDDLLQTRAIAVSEARFNAQAGQQAFERDVQSYLTVMEKYEGVPYRSNALLGKAFTEALRSAGKESLEANDNASAQDLFDRAHKAVTEQFAGLGLTLGKKPGAKPGAAPAPTAAAAPAPAPAPKAAREVPPTLGKLPAAASNGPSDVFAQIATLEGEDLEMAIARMSPAERRKLEMAD